MKVRTVRELTEFLRTQDPDSLVYLSTGQDDCYMGLYEAKEGVSVEGQRFSAEEGIVSDVCLSW